ncbi:aminoglycoside phosphotransferase family protein [Streptomyces roseirectus]|uniref:Aminoglycoside phosphotransferase family protein n=1 Tax=Streptomyces roseirectus TaxID=2768066 RepID=A0A7H0I9K9_9ACTN|nr:aminoglycoside phosphotransferase family protein [Streptomyces roseirectus]QNP69475.1 aminoglycoside phosphotransferase family protein [Streptomyces roseirectus]
MMHENEIRTDVALVRRLLAAQFPEWAGAAVAEVRTAATNNAVYRLGDGLVVRLPIVEEAVEQAEFEETWLPRLAPSLPAPVPEPVALGRPGEGYPFPWTVSRWIEGTHPTGAEGESFARELGAFVAALRTAGTEGAPTGYRGVPLRSRDVSTRAWIATAAADVDVSAVLAAWEHALAQPEWDGPPVWAHGDLIPGNVLVREGELGAVIDFGAAGVGDPACDAIPAWALLDAAHRSAFREAAGFDDATWARGRGWALTFVSGIDYYRTTNPAMSELGLRTVNSVLADLG